jgi:copper(I)-binding protein
VSCANAQTVSGKNAKASDTEGKVCRMGTAMPLGELQENLHEGEGLPLNAVRSATAFEARERRPGGHKITCKGGGTMKKFGILVASVVATSALSGAPASATDYRWAHSRSRAHGRAQSQKEAKVAVGYMTIKNTGTEPDRLVSGVTPVAAGFMVHKMTMDNGVMKMRPLASGLEIKPGEKVELKPGSFHIMITDLNGRSNAASRSRQPEVREGGGRRCGFRGRGRRCQFRCHVRTRRPSPLMWLAMEF